MEKPKINLIAGIQATDRGIGKDGDLLYHIPADMQRFKEITKDNTVIMGRKTWESIPEKFRPLPNRNNIVVTSNLNYQADGAVVVHSLDEALQKSRSQKPEADIFIIGGQQLYTESLSKADRLYLTIFEGEKEADTFFPKYKNLFTKEIDREDHVDEKTGMKFSFIVLEK